MCARGLTRILRDVGGKEGLREKEEEVCAGNEPELSESGSLGGGRVAVGRTQGTAPPHQGSVTPESPSPKARHAQVKSGGFCPLPSTPVLLLLGTCGGGGCTVGSFSSPVMAHHLDLVHMFLYPSAPSHGVETYNSTVPGLSWIFG